LCICWIIVVKNITYPDVQVSVSIPGIKPSRRKKLYVVVLAPDDN
jgi:hypothetical protein